VGRHWTRVSFDFLGLKLELEDLLGCWVDLLERRSLKQMKNPFKGQSILSCVKMIYAAEAA
jgi:predicted nucleotidyltransferase